MSLDDLKRLSLPYRSLPPSPVCYLLLSTPLESAFGLSRLFWVNVMRVRRKPSLHCAFHEAHYIDSHVVLILEIGLILLGT